MKDLPIQRLQHKIAFERDERSYKALFIHFYNPLLHFANSLLKSREASEEVVSDVMMNIWQMKADLVNISNLKIYLYKAVKNRALSCLNRNKKYTSLDLDNLELQLDYSLYVDSPEANMMTNELRQQIGVAVKALPPKCQMAYKLVREDGLSYKEVAAIMEISTNTVDRHLNNALHKLIDAVKVHFH